MQFKVSFADLRTIENHDPDSDSGYWFVNRTKNSWTAKIFGCRVGPACKTATEAAKQVITWMKEIYGDEWKKYFQYRNERAYYPVKINDKWQMVVYLFGTKHIIGSPKSRKKTILKWFKNWKRSEFILYKHHDIALRCKTPSDCKIDKTKAKTEQGS